MSMPDDMEYEEAAEIAEDWYDELIARFAGREARKRFLGIDDLQSDDDLEACEMYSLALYVATYRAEEEHYEECEKYAADLIKANWGLIARVAETLISRGDLSSEEVNEIAGDAQDWRGGFLNHSASETGIPTVCCDQ